ncbi:1-aminocyclopropane-1-carboxylate synthase-like protein 1 [Neoarius graeffei]|uniref:1-aminocyclopropane-1-carboxylate synthase-like protein 1 n=1 Tax=Neoarius graeffei TaxID=443677 RepID=UPI00298CE9AF|nr:1-aminocyclopropane-1-carboxylate synthase-like protein 1 [Neoarius graeffei]XP_060770988.1 1-aminocyclopropane-1-carboxylate synthase-like protein 1 [Neoarius graeffei]XP_060770989.1 1-aminocyclopropane-1-carboxylate synthase-like protein 1 [Neoarius graeffei]
MDFPTKKYERGSNWSEPEVVELLQLWSDEAVQLELESCLRNQHVFNRIAVALHDRSIYRTADQCREKIKKLKLDYRRMKENQQTPRGARARRFYDVIDRVLSSRAAASSSSSSYSALWGNAGVHQQAGPASSSSAFTFSCPPKAGELMEIKLEELNADGEEELLSAEDPLCSEEEAEADCKSAGADTEDPGERGGECAAHTGWSPSGFSDHNVAGSSGAGFSPVAVPVTSVDRCTQADLKDPKYSTRFHPRKRRRAVRAGSGGRLLEKALASFINWQQVMEERYASLEEMRLHQEARAEKERQHQEERRVQQEREHELRLVSLLAGAFSAARRTSEQGSSNTETSDPSATVSELTLLSVPPAFTPNPATTPTVPRILQEGHTVNQEQSNTMILYSNADVSVPSQSPFVPRILKDNQRADEGNTSTTTSDCNTTASDLATFSVPHNSSGPGPEPSTHPFVLSMLQGDKTPQHSKLLSRRGNSIRHYQGLLQEGYTQYFANKHDENSNPDGIINLGTSENKLCSDLLQKRLTQPDMFYVDSCLLQYADWKGHRFLREEVAEFLSVYCHAPRPLKADNVVMINGCGSLFSAIAAVLCDPDDAILIPTPFYGVIAEDVGLYSSVKLYCVPLDSEPSQNDERPFRLTAEKLEHALQQAQKEGVNIKAIILVNPHNPLGDVYTSEEMISFLNCAKRHELHAIVDELYMLSVFDGSFNSILSLPRLPDPQRTHVMWGVSKDLAMAGVRVGTVYSENCDLIEALGRLGYFHGLAGPTQHQVSQLLKDRDWMNKVFLPENRRRLQEAHQYVSTELKRLNIPYLHRGAGFFIWADFNKYLKEHTFAEELRLWRCFLKHRVLLSCGQAFSCSSPGWFRIIFSDQRHRLQLGLERIREALEELHCSSILTDCENTKADKQEDDRQTQRRRKTEDKNNKDHSKDTTIEAFISTTKEHLESKGAVGENLSLADEDVQVNNYQTFANSESLDSLIGALRQQIHSSDWLEKNRPKLADGEDATQAEVFKDLLDRARM